MTKLLVTYYSSYGHMYKMAQAAADAAAEHDEYEVELKKIPELDAARKAMSEQDAYVKAQEAQKDVEEVTLDDLDWADGIVWGIPTRFGNMPAQVKQFMDTAGGLWAQGKLEGKAAGIHFGMIFVGSPYGENPEMNTDKLQGGSPYGPSTVAGPDGSKMPTEGDLNMAGRLAERVAKVASGVKEVY